MRRDRADSSTDHFLELYQGLWVPFIYTQETLGIPTGKNRMGSDQGSWLARDVECCARSRAYQSTPGWSHVRYAGWPHLAGTTGWHECPRTFAASPSRTS